MNKKYFLIAACCFIGYNPLQASPLKNIAIISTIITTSIGASYIAYQNCNDSSPIKKRVCVQKDYMCDQCINLLEKAKSTEENDNDSFEPLRGPDEEKLKTQMLKELRKASRFIRQQKDNSCDYMIKVLQRAKSSPQMIVQDKIESGMDRAKDTSAKIMDNVQKQTQNAIDKINQEFNKPKR